MDRAELEKVLRAAAMQEFHESWSGGMSGVEFEFEPVEGFPYVGDPCRVDDDCVLYFRSILPADWLKYAVHALWTSLYLASSMAEVAAEWGRASDIWHSGLTGPDLLRLEGWLSGGGYARRGVEARFAQSMRVWKLLQEPERWGGGR